ncbi:dihydroorotate dehydrogenase [Streptomyces sp. SAI-133]|uniref:hypothetical protein n=1 Tax=unclassified Streptomyces TaxID=2593676 RepID=UPI002476718B|nr:hypothetical protein [Streptomyces sp. SAI-133]MDH6590098.1 dihydroorotate dehydrogenase [Streptomyces sp. SAI-133]
MDCPLIVKLPGQASDIVGMARAAADNGADTVTVIRASPAMIHTYFEYITSEPIVPPRRPWPRP